MKKIIFTIATFLVISVSFSQNSNTPQRLKYVTEAPDGSIAMTIYDDSRDDSMKLESADSFYKYEIVEPSTSEAIYSSGNQGKECQIDKTKFNSGTYDIRLYTSNFVITSKITITATRKLLKPILGGGLAMAATE